MRKRLASVQKLPTYFIPRMTKTKNPNEEKVSLNADQY